MFPSDETRGMPRGQGLRYRLAPSVVGRFDTICLPFINRAITEPGVCRESDDESTAPQEWASKISMLLSRVVEPYSFANSKCAYNRWRSARESH
jgi:hypothetical protein